MFVPFLFRFTLSRPVTAAVPPGDKRLFRKALDLAHAFEPLRSDEEPRISQIAANLSPLFSYPAQG